MKNSKKFKSKLKYIIFQLILLTIIAVSVYFFKGDPTKDILISFSIVALGYLVAIIICWYLYIYKNPK